MRAAIIVAIYMFIVDVVVLQVVRITDSDNWSSENTVWLFVHLLTWVCTWLSLKWHCSTLIIQCWVSLISSWNSQPGITVNAHWSPYGPDCVDVKWKHWVYQTYKFKCYFGTLLFWDLCHVHVDWRLDLQTWDMLRVHIRDLLVPDECVHVRHNTYVTGETHVTAACP